MKKILALITVFICAFQLSFGQERTAIFNQFQSTHSFIENKGQFDGKNWHEDADIKYAMSQNPFHIFFSSNGLTYRFDKLIKNPKRKEDPKAMPKRVNISELVHVEWLGSNSNAEIIAEEKLTPYYSYSFNSPTSNELVNVNHINGYNKITYKNLYDNIDVEYLIHSEGGVKYNVILHPGADPSQLKLKYTANHTSRLDEKIEFDLNSEGELVITTSLGSVVEHKPYTFYDESNESIASNYKFENNILSFNLSEYDNSKKVIIDPWIVSPNYTTSTAAWEVETDAVGNVYSIGGETPMELKKYNAAGVLQWTYVTPWDTNTVWLGTLATDALGNSFVTSGVTANMHKVDNAGNFVWATSPSGNLQYNSEWWSITFNCDESKLIVGGTWVNGMLTFDFYAGIFEVDVNSGAILSDQTVDYTDLTVFGATPVEVRSISSSKNAKYIFLTHQEVGAINDNLGECPSNEPLYQVSNQSVLGYKCENYLPSTQNGGGLKALVANDNFFYTHNGAQIRQWDLETGALLNTVNLPGGSNTTSFGQIVVHCSGLDVDECGNLYAGSTNQIVKYDPNLTMLESAPTTFAVYDVDVNSNGEVIACGAQQNNQSTNRNGRIQSVDLTACAQFELVCCDANFCNPGVLCETDPSVTLIPSTPGGVWSGVGVDASGVFDPSVAGVGSHTITYTLPCGENQLEIVVSSCEPLEACLNTDGSITVSNGIDPYNWEEYIAPTSSPISNQTQCESCGYTWFFGSCLNGATPVTTCDTPGGYEFLASGNNITPGTNFPIRITDPSGAELIINDLSELQDCVEDPCPTIDVIITTQENVSCFGGNDGSATVSASGGTDPYTYTWMPGSLNGATQNNLTAQTYTVNVTDSEGCPGTVQVNITQPVALSATTSSTEACGGNDGSATINVSGGTGAYTYDWNPNVGNTATVTDLSVGDYEVTVTDENGCTIVETISVTCGVVPCPTITVSITNQTDVLCFGGNTGTATVSASGGNGPYTYTWMPENLNGATQNSLSAQTYTVNVVDNDGCPGTVQVTINQPTQLTATTSSVEASCGESDGSATVNPSGGTGAYSYTWSPNVGSTATVNNIPAGSYQVTVTDANNCQHQENILVNNQNAPTVSILSTTDESCVGAADGEATVEASGGSGNYTYSWSPSGGTNATASNLTAGNYTVTVTDDAGCETSIVVTINSASVILIDAIITDEDCGVMNGELVASASGGNGNYSYTWSNGETTSTISNLQTGEYSVTVTDDLGCSNSETFTVGVIGSLDVTVNPTTTTIEAGESVQLEASGGFTYIWTPETGLSCTDCPNPIASPINTTSYTVTAVDENGCAGEATVLVFVEALCGEFFVPTIFSPNADGTNDKHCVLGGCVREFELIIYNRWGERVFVSRDQSNCWDGYFRGEQVQSGVYVYKIKATLVDGTMITDSGNINVIR